VAVIGTGQFDIVVLLQNNRLNIGALTESLKVDHKVVRVSCRRDYCFVIVSKVINESIRSSLSIMESQDSC